MIQTIVANKIGSPRRETLHGKTYVVTPVRMIVPGVLTGNRGALLYEKDDIRRSVPAWNMMPIVVNHPMDGNQFVSARSPKVLEKTGIGFVFNAVQDKDGNLDGEAWVDIEKARSIDPALADRVERGDQIEVSTGLGTVNQKKTGEYKGKKYDAVARNYAPDHLAVLPSGTGACSLKDGCGLSVNQLDEEFLPFVEAYNEADTDLRFSSWLVANAGKVGAKKGSCGCGGGEGKPCQCTDNGCGGKKKHQTMNSDDEDMDDVGGDSDPEDEVPPKKPVKSKKSKMTSNFTFASVLNAKAGGCGAGGGKGRPGFQPSNSCAKGSGRAGFAKAKTATPAQKKAAKKREAAKSGGSSGGGEKKENPKKDAKSKTSSTPVSSLTKDQAKVKSMYKKANKLIDEGNALVADSNQTWGKRSDKLYAAGQKKINQGVRLQSQADSLAKTTSQKKSSTSESPKSKKSSKINISDAQKALAAEGSTLGKSTTDLKTKKTSWQVTDKSGKTKTMTSDELKAKVQGKKSGDSEFIKVGGQMVKPGSPAHESMKIKVERDKLHAKSVKSTLTQKDKERLLELSNRQAELNKQQSERESKGE